MKPTFPDGSKEGWEESVEGDRRRAEFLKWIAESDVWCDWVEVIFGGDDWDARVTHCRETVETEKARGW